jgi:hypothetical protein
MSEYSYPDLYRNRPVIVLVLYFDQEGLALNKGLVELSVKTADWLGIEWHKVVVAFQREDLPIRNYYEYKRTRKRWSDVLKLMETEEIETFGVNHYTTDHGEEECAVALNVDVCSAYDRPSACYLHVVPDVLDPGRVGQANAWLLPFITQATELFKPYYGFVHIGDWGLNWYLYASGMPDSSFPVEGSLDVDMFSSADTLRVRVPRVYWGNLLSTEHIKQLGNVDELRAWELGSQEWDVYHNTVPTEEYRRLAGIPPAEPGTRADWPVQVYEPQEGYIFFTLTSDPLDWSPNIGIGGLVTAEYRRITALFRSKGLIP